LAVPNKIEELLQMFSEGVVKHRENMCEDSEVANRAHDKYMKAVKALVSLGEEGTSAFARLMDCPIPAVRISTAIYLISFYPDRSIKLLQEETTGGRMSPEALVALERWKRGTYLDPLTGKEVARPRIRQHDAAHRL
jgi:hypothetical protein